MFPSEDFALILKCFSLYTGSLSNPFLMVLLTLLQISLYFPSNSVSSLKKSYIFSFIKSFIYTHSFLEALYTRAEFIIIFVTNNLFKTFLTKRNAVIYNYSVNFYIIHCDWVFVLVKFLFQFQ